MSNLIQEINQELMKHACNLCDKSFPSGRSLGGHMRSHVINSPDRHHHHQLQQKKKQMKKLLSVNNGGKFSKNDTVAIDGSSTNFGYEMKKDPKKTPKIENSSEIENKSCLVVLDKLCKECGKGFQSWKALFGHMKCHSEKVSNNNNFNRDSSTRQSDNENSSRIKKSKSRNGKIERYKVTSTTTAIVTTTTITTASSSISMNANNNKNNNQISSNPASTSVVSEIEQDQESEIAMCLMMLSRDDGKLGNEFKSSDSDYCNSSAFVGLTKVEGKKRIVKGFKIKKLAETQVSVDYFGRSEVGFTGLTKTTIQNEEFNDESKRKFDCVTCNKSFDSYQALGGHKASHKKLKMNLDPKTEGENIIENKPFFDHENIINGFDSKPNENHQTAKSFNLGAHECPICSKIFSSGQALGGHKRSHMVAEAKLNQVNQQISMNLIEKENEPVREIRNFFDLNMLPDTMEEEMIMNSSSTGYQPWHHESTTLLGLLSTI